ncbi:MAG TPA: 16S rRNA (guanine(966)-N(2))-methyltransferase RsmD [Vicinamibacterales bacterium]|nr:16S rRNA (guanine(966)-N(2))-methyltransferase RsmD [Vicinamibacterales bacterium]
MRIIAGTLRGRRLQAPPGSRVRPTSDSLRETLFNVLGPSLDGARVLDAFAGTGALGLEAISRGAAHATFVERDPTALRVLRENIDACGAAEACAIIRGNFPIALEQPKSLNAQRSFDLILLDPPYEIEDLLAVVAAAAAFAASSGRVVLEHSRRRISPEAAGPLRRARVLTAGDSALSFYARESSVTRID